MDTVGLDVRYKRWIQWVQMSGIKDGYSGFRCQV